MRLALVAVALPLLLAACGGHERQRASDARVRLKLSSPTDSATVRAGAIEVTGTVRPGRADVQVAGRAADVRDGKFTASVPLQAGANVIDVAATASGARPALAAVRVIRDVRVTVPQLAGEDPDSAVQRLEGLGLKVDRERGGGFLDPILPTSPRVCETQPGAGARLERGSHVTLVWARHC